MKKSYPKSSNARNIDTAIHNILKSYQDYFIVQEILINYQKYFAKYNIEQNRLLIGKQHASIKNLNKK